MARKRRRKVELAKAALIEFFEAAPHRVYTHDALQKVLDQQLRPLVGWGLSGEDFIEFLTQNTPFHAEQISRTMHPAEPFVRFVWRDASPFEVTLSLSPRSY